MTGHTPFIFKEGLQLDRLVIFKFFNRRSVPFFVLMIENSSNRSLTIIIVNAFIVNYTVITI